jgi:hypothetical protein
MNAPDDQFDILAPGILESFKQSINNPNDRIALVQALNALGYTIDDMIVNLDDILNGLDELPISVAKKDFFK